MPRVYAAVVDHPALRRDALIASLLALVLGVAWAWANWANLRQLRLPDTDDAMRLQQVRDWLAGQPFADLTQHRLGSGVPMHWSRLADLGPAAFIIALTPLLGQHGAEMAAVIVWPLLLFTATLFLIARIARVLGGEGLAGTACAVAAIGYPATTLFLPGRIDHHGLQMLLLLVAVWSLLRPAGVMVGLTAGLCAAASLTIGLETAPLFAAIGAAMVVDWVLARRDASVRLAGLGAGTLTGLIMARGIFAPWAWDFPACDGFTGQAWRAGMALAFVPLGLAMLDRSVTGRRGRMTAGIAITGGLGTVALSLSPGCLHPYGAVDPLLATLWLSHVGEAQSLFAAPIGTAVGYAGLMIAGIAATIWRLRATREHGWAVLLAVQVTALGITAIQLRGAYAGALLAAPALAAVIGAARARGSTFVAAAWIASAGMIYPLAAEALTPARSSAATAQGDCESPAMLAALDRLPPGEMIAPIDAGAAILAGTHHRVVAAPYHRNGDGNLATYRFFLRPPDAGRAIATAWHARYVLICDSDLATLGAGPASLARRLATGSAPGWLAPLPAPAGVHLYETRR